eukprot:527007-Hanusia_phi.AAC.1
MALGINDFDKYANVSAVKVSSTLNATVLSPRVARLRAPQSILVVYFSFVPRQPDVHNLTVYGCNGEACEERILELQ